MKKIIINRKKLITNGKFGFDGCHKIYICEDDADVKKLEELGYTILPTEKLEETFNNSCFLRFISNAKLTKYYVNQCESAKFRYEE